jgi:hypothetical protein
MESSYGVMAVKNVMFNQLEEYLNRRGDAGLATGCPGDHGEDDRQRRRNDLVFVFKKAGVGHYPPKDITGVDLDVIQWQLVSAQRTRQPGAGLNRLSELDVEDDEGLSQASHRATLAPVRRSSWRPGPLGDADYGAVVLRDRAGLRTAGDGFLLRVDPVPAWRGAYTCSFAQP